MDIQQPWDRQSGEPLIWYRRLTALRLMSPTRSIAAVYQQESKKGEKESNKPPGRWYDIARAWQWDARCAAYDEHQAKELEATIAAEKKKVLSEGYALMHQRVRTLDILTRKLIGYLDDEQNIWLPDVKGIGNGPTAQRVDLVRFNDALFLVIDKYLGSIASEMGERIKISKQELTGANGKPLLPGKNELLEAMTDQEFEELKRLQAAALARLEHNGNSTTDN